MVAFVLKLKLADASAQAPQQVLLFTVLLGGHSARATTSQVERFLKEERGSLRVPKQRVAPMGVAPAPHSKQARVVAARRVFKPV